VMGKNSKRSPVVLPTNADELLALDHAGLDRLAWELQIRLGRRKRARGAVLSSGQPDQAAVAKLNGEISGLGALLSATNERRGQIRGEHRRAAGSVPDRNEAVAVAVDRLLTGPLWQRIQDEATRIQDRAEADLIVNG